MPWSDDLHADLVREAATGAYAGDIARRLGVTRNAVIGRAWRTGVALQAQPSAARRRAAEQHAERLDAGYQPKRRTA